MGASAMTPLGVAATIDNNTETNIRIPLTSVIAGVTAVTDLFRTWLGNAAAGAITFNLPTAVGRLGERFTFKKIDGSVNTVTVTAFGGQMIDGSASKVLVAQYEAIDIESDGANWVVVVNTSVSGGDIYAATRVVSLIAGDGTDLTIASALAALPAEGGRIFVKQGVYPQVVTLALPDAPVEIICASQQPDQIVGSVGTIIDIGANIIAVFTKAFKKNFRITGATIRGTGLVGQTFFDSSAVADGSGWVVVEDCNINYLQTCFLNGGTTLIRMSKVQFQPSFAFDAKFTTGSGAFIEATQVKIEGSLLEDYPTLTLTGCDFGCSVFSGLVVNTVQAMVASSSKLGGAFEIRSGRIVGCEINIGSFGVPQVRYIDIPAGGGAFTLTGCTFTFPGTSEELRTASERLSFYGNVGSSFIPKVAETGAADNNRYEDVALSSTIIGLHSIVDQWNTRTVVAALTLDESHRTVLADVSGGAFTITLPTAASAKFRKYIVKKTDVSGNAVTIDAAGAETIDGALTVAISTQYGVIAIQSNGTAWSVLVSELFGGDLFAATRIVSLTPGQGTDLTIAAAIAALPAAGGDIYVKGGIYPIPASLDFGAKVVRLRGAAGGSTFGASVTTLVPAAGISLFKNGGAGSSVEDIAATGDNATSQVFYEGTSDIRFTRIVTSDIAGIVKGGTPEVLFRDSVLFVPSGPGIPLADRYIWKSTSAGGTLIWDNVEVFISGGGATMMSGITASQNGPTFKVVNSYTGGGGGGGTANFWFCEVIDWVGLDIDNAQFEISGSRNNVVNCNFLDFSIKFKAVWNFVSNSNFSGGGTGGAGLFSAQLDFAPAASFAGILTEDLVTGCNFYGGGVALTGVNVTNSAQADISGCIFSSHVSRGVFLAAGAAPNPSKASVIGCRFETETTPVVEGDAANCVGRYESNQNFGGSTILGTKSIVNEQNVFAVAAGLTLDESHRTVVASAAGGAFTIALPTAASAKYRKYTVKKTDATVNAVTIDPSGAETIDGAATFLLTVQYQSIDFISDGTTWWIV